MPAEAASHRKPYMVIATHQQSPMAPTVPSSDPLFMIICCDSFMETSIS